MNNSVTLNGITYTLEADKHEKVSFLMKAGLDTVRNVMSLDGAIRTIKESIKITNAADEHPHHPICVDWKFYFPGTIEVSTPLMGEEPQEETPPPKHHGFGKKRK